MVDLTPPPDVLRRIGLVLHRNPTVIRGIDRIIGDTVLVFDPVAMVVPVERQYDLPRHRTIRRGENRLHVPCIGVITREGTVRRDDADVCRRADRFLKEIEFIRMQPHARAFRELPWNEPATLAVMNKAAVKAGIIRVQNDETDSPAIEPIPASFHPECFSRLFGSRSIVIMVTDHGMSLKRSTGPDVDEPPVMPGVMLEITELDSEIDVLSDTSSDDAFQLLGRVVREDSRTIMHIRRDEKPHGFHLSETRAPANRQRRA